MDKIKIFIKKYILLLSKLNQSNSTILTRFQFLFFKKNQNYFSEKNAISLNFSNLRMINYLIFFRLNI
jgi:hypothetical protein